MALIPHEIYNYSLKKSTRHKIIIRMNLRTSCFYNKQNLGKKDTFFNSEFWIIRNAENWRRMVFLPLTPCLMLKNMIREKLSLLDIILLLIGVKRGPDS